MLDSITYKPKLNAIHIIFKEDVEIYDVKNVLEKIKYSDSFDPEVNALWDAREITFDNLDAKWKIGLAELVKKYGNRQKSTTKTAYLVSGEHAKVQFHTYMMFAEQNKNSVELFTDFQEACNWLLK